MAGGHPLTLGPVGMVVIDKEWWHWSYGDQWWAVQKGEPHALYGEKEA